MNDPEVIFPFHERALEHGVTVIAVHKAVALGPVETDDALSPADIEAAAGAFPDLTFEIVHGGISSAGETGWLLARFPDIHIDLEISTVILELRPRTFSTMLLEWLEVGGMPILDRLVWGTGCTLAHPRPTIDSFCQYEIPEDLLQDAGLFGPLPRSPISTSAASWPRTTPHPRHRHPSPRGRHRRRRAAAAGAAREGPLPAP